MQYRRGHSRAVRIKPCIKNECLIPAKTHHFEVCTAKRQLVFQGDQCPSGDVDQRAELIRQRIDHSHRRMWRLLDPSRQCGQGVHEEVGLEMLLRSEEHTSELQSLMRISYAVFCLK